MSFCSNAASISLLEACENDMTGELYSEITDASLDDQFSSIGINQTSKYLYLFEDENNAHLSFMDIIEKYQAQFPELKMALDKKLKEICLERGPDIL